MDASFNGNEMSENQERNNSCNSFINKAFADDDTPPRYRSYCCNRFSRHTFSVVMMLAVYLLLLLGCMTTATETNQTTTHVLTNPAEAYISTTKQDVDNEISATIEENPISVEKTNFLESTLTENLEDTIRNSVKSEIELEQNVGSPALLNALNVMPQTENIVLVEYPGATTSVPKHEISIDSHSESAVDTQCDASSLVCVWPKRKEVPLTTTVNIMESNVAISSTVVPDIDVLPTTTVVTVELETTTLVPETETVDIGEQSPREGKTLESENIVQNVEQSSNSDVNIDVLSQHEHQTKLETLSKNEEENLSEQPEILVEPIDENSNPEEVAPTTVLDDKKSVESESTNATHANESEVINEPVETALTITNETQLSGLPNSNEPLNTSLETNENQELVESVPQATNTISTQSEIEISPATVSNEQISDVNEPALQADIQSLPTLTSNDRKSDANVSNQVETASTQHNITELQEQQSIAVESAQSPQPSLTTTSSSEPSIVEHTNLDLANDTLSIIFEEPLPVNETSIEHIDDYVKTIIDMEDPLLSEIQIDHTTVQPEQPIHNVIKKQGVEPIDVEEPLNEIDLETQSETLLPIPAPVSEEDTVQEVEDAAVHAIQPNDNNETVIITQPESSLPSIFNSVETKAQDITEVSVVFSGKGDVDAGLNGKGSRSINALHSPLTHHQKASINFDVYPAGQTFNGNLAEELPNGIGKALPTHRLSEQSSNRSTLLIALCSGIALLFIVISVAIFMISFQRQHGTLDIEMQERRDNINDEEAETCLKLLDIELPNTSLALQTEAEAEIEECL